MRFSALLAGTATVLLIAAAPAFAETITYDATVSPATEVPPVTNSKATGHVSATYDTDTHMLTYDASYADLTGPASMAHFHGPAPAGKNAGVMVPITGSLESPMKGSVKLTDDQAKALMNGDVYFNIHTAMNKGGEMRGQMERGK